MTRFVAPALVSALLLLPCSVAPLHAQERAVREASLPPEYEERLLRIYGSEDAVRYTGEANVRRGDEVRRDVAARGGRLRVEGRVVGDLAMMYGDVVVAAGGSVTGDLIVVGGAVHLEDGARVGGRIVEFAARSRPARVAGRPERDERDRRDEDEMRDEWDEDRDRWRYGDRWAFHGPGAEGFSLVSLRLGPTYNRVEGLPVLFGPVVRTPGPRSLEVEALAIVRTGAEPALGTERWGYRATVTQHLAGQGRLRIGGSLFSVVEPLDRWQLGDDEASLAAVGFHQDFRDHYGVEGWSAFLGMRPVPELDLRAEFREAEHRSLAAADPWTLFRRSDAWRPQPLVGEGRLRSVSGSVELDLRDDRRESSSGWLGRLRLERALGGDLVRPGLLSSLPDDGAGGGGTVPPGGLAPEAHSTDFTTFFADLRRYMPVGRRSGLAVRIVGGGNVEEGPLPPQFQHALGGPGSLPGHSVFLADCGARAAAGTRDGAAFHPAYGCDRFVLGQVEYRGRIEIDLGFGEPDRDRGRKHWHDVDVDLDPRWAVFFDAGRGWSYDDALPGGVGTTGTLYDAGVGFLFDEVGLYLALPLNEGVERDTRFFIRLQRRF